MESDDKYYLAATREFDGESRDEGKWAKSLALCEGDKRKAKYKYINLRADELCQKAENPESLSHKLFQPIHHVRQDSE